MKQKLNLIIVLLMLAFVFLTGCMDDTEVICNYDGVCDDGETNDCTDCADVLGRGVQYPAPVETDEVEAP